MKFVLVFVAVVGLSCAASIEPEPNPRTLRDDWIEFVTMIPRGPIINILVRYLATDSEIQGMVMHLVSPEVTANIQELDQERDFLNLIDYLEEHQLAGMYDFLNAVNSFFNWGVINPNVPIKETNFFKDFFSCGLKKAEMVGMFSGKWTAQDLIDHVAMGDADDDMKAGWTSMWGEISAVWPGDEVKAFHADKMNSSADYILLFKDLGSNECRDLIIKVVELPSWMRGVTDVRKGGINVDLFNKFIRNLLGWNSPSGASKAEYGTYALLVSLLALLMR